MTFEMGIGPNIRKSPYFDATVQDGVRSFSVYNHMYIPGHFGDPELEYKRLIEGVAMWDVGAQRQVEISGPDAATLVQYLTPRDLSGTQIGQGRYVPICNYEGILINDPVLLKLAETRYWLSIADSDIELWASAIAAERGLSVSVMEPDVSPLAIQGPKATELVASMFGDWIRELKYFWFKATEIEGIPLVLARSGWSKQGGFELYLQDSARGSDLWQMVKQAGAEFNIGPGAPNDIERLESGLLSYGADARLQVNPANPFELGLGKLVDLDRDDDFVGKQALLKLKADGVKRKLVGFTLDGAAVGSCEHGIPITRGDVVVGQISETAYSQRLQQNIALGLINLDALDSGQLTVEIDGSQRQLKEASIPFI
ncbi:MAG: glycine cleavage T C-terminal barrel domain-containing protein [Pseudomonadota bacterium]